jgi:hypothetical protein
VVADVCLDAGRFRAALDDPVSVLLVKGLAREKACFSVRGAEQVAASVAGDAGGSDIVIQEVIEIVVTGDVMLLAAFFMEPDSSAAALNEIIADLHLE